MCILYRSQVRGGSVCVCVSSSVHVAQGRFHGIAGAQVCTTQLFAHEILMQSFLPVCTPCRSTANLPKHSLPQPELALGVCVSVCVCTCACVCVCMCVYLHTSTRLSVCLCFCLFSGVCILCVCTNLRVRTHAHARMHLHLYAHTLNPAVEAHTSTGNSQGRDMSGSPGSCSSWGQERGKKTGVGEWGITLTWRP